MEGIGIFKKNTQASGAVKAPMLTTSAASFRQFGSEVEAEGIPEDWYEQAVQAWRYYKEEPIVNNCCNAWRTLALGENFSVLVSGDDDTQKDIDGMIKRLGLRKWLYDGVLQLLTKGECAVYKEYGGTKRGTGRGGDPLYNDFARVKNLNPTTVIPVVEDGLLRSVSLKEGDSSSTTGETSKISLAQFRRWLWDAPDFETHGTSMVLPAFESIELLRDYRRADRAIAKRWATPIRLIKVGGVFGRQTVMPKQKQLDDLKTTFDSMTAKQGAVVPFYVSIETYGAEGETLDTEKKIQEAKTDIIVAMGFTRALVSGDGSNFSTASMGFAKIQLMLVDIRKVAEEMLTWVIDDYLEMKGKKGIAYQVVFPGVDLSNGADQRKVLLEMYDRGLISRRTLQTMTGLNPEVEQAQMAKETKQVLAPMMPGDIVGLVQQGYLSEEEMAFLLNMKERLKGFSKQGGDTKATDPADDPPKDAVALYHDVNDMIEARARQVVAEFEARLRNAS